MARPISQEKRDAFLAAAMKLFVAKGVQNTSTAEIAREAGTAAGTLFLYFPTKQDLIHALVLNISWEQSAAINATLQAPGLTARERFWRIWEGSLRWFIEHMEAYQYVQQVRDSNMIAPDVIEESSRDLGYYYEAIRQGLAEGSIQPYPPELVGGVLYQQVVAVMNLIRTQPDPAAREGYIRQGWEIFWNGIRAEGPTQAE